MRFKNIPIQFYLGGNIREKDNLKLITMAVFVKATIEGICENYRFDQLCDNIRGIMSGCNSTNAITKEVKAKIKVQKSYYPFITPSIFGDNGSKMDGYKFNGLFSFDVDVADNPAFLNVDYRQEMKSRLMDLPNIIYAAVSPSGGIKLLIYVGICQSDKEFKTTYSILIKYIEAKTGLVLDKATSAPNQNMFIPYDPEVLFDENKHLLNQEELMALIKENTQVPALSYSITDATNPKVVFISDDVAENLAKADWYINQLRENNIDATAAYKDYIGLCFSFTSLGEDARGHWLKLCSMYPNYDVEECNEKFTHCLDKFDGRKNIGSFFWECENRYKLTPYARSNADHIISGPSGDATNSAAPFSVSIQENEDDNGSNLVISPYLFASIEEKLPRFIKEIMQQYSNPRQKDIIALTLINAISGMFSNLKVCHFNTISHANTYSVIIAPPGAGKGVATVGRKIMNALDEYILSESRKDLIEWKGEDEATRPNDPPLLRHFLMPLDTTSAATINFLLASKGSGAIIETEMGVGNTIFKQWDTIKTILLKGFQNEDYDVNRKGEGLKKVKVHFGTTMTTTPSTALSMISHEDGLLSRVTIYNFNECVDFDDCTFDYRRAFEGRDYIEKAAEYIKQMYIDVSQNPEMVYVWSEENQQKLLKFFRTVRARSLKMFGEDFDASMKRTALMASRYAALLTFLNDYDNGNLPLNSPQGIRIIPDECVAPVIKLMNASLWHARTFYDSLEIKPKVIDSKRNRIYHLLCILPNEFKLQDLDKVFLEKARISPKTLERRLNDCLEQGLLEKVKHGFYRKTDKCPK